MINNPRKSKSGRGKALNKHYSYIYLYRIFRISVMALALTLTLTSCIIYTNFYEVDAGRFYRSAQLNKLAFYGVIKKYGLKSVINLRDQGKYFSRLEKQWCEKKGIRYYNIPVTCGSRDKLLKVIETIRSAEKPVLVHCFGGKDRTGLVSAIYVSDFQNNPMDAFKQFSIKYLYIRAFDKGCRATFENYMKETDNGKEATFEKWLKAKQPATGGQADNIYT